MTKQPTSFRNLWDIILLLGVVALLVTLAIWMAASQFSSTLASWTEPDPLAQEAAQAAFAEETGVKIMSVGLVMNGGMIDMRYQVVDPDKAIIVHDDDYPPGFIHEASGQLINTPYHEHSIFDAHTAITYYELIMNPGGVMKRGDKITVLIGQSRLENVIIQ